MRYAWIALLIIVLDQTTKWLLPLMGFGGTWHTGLGGFTIELLQHKTAAAASIEATATNNTSLALLAGLLAIYLFITRWSSHFHFIANRAAIGLQLTGGGLTSHVFDLALKGRQQSAFRFSNGEQFSIDLGFAELALITGFILLLATLLRGSTKVYSKVKLASSHLPSLHFNILPRGIDNIHIDVHISPQFRKNIGRMVHTLIPLVIKQLQQGSRRPLALPKRQVETLRSQFHDLLNIALHRAKVTGEKQLPDLLLVATFKLVHAEVNNSVAAILQKSKEGRKEHALRGFKPKSNDRIIAWLFRYRDDIIALSNRLLLEAVCTGEKETLKKGAKSYLGKDSLFALHALESPLVLAESSTSERLQMEHYITLGQQQSDENSFVNIDTLLSEVFDGCLELIEKSKTGGNKEIEYLQRGGDINSNTIHSLSQPSVLMNPANVSILLDTDWTQNKLKKTNKFSDIKRYRKLLQHRRFQRLLHDKLKLSLKKAGLATWVVAGFEARKLLLSSGSNASAAQLTALLARKQSKQEFTQKLADTFRGMTTPPPEGAVTEVWQKVHKQQEPLLDVYLLPFVRRFAHYRRDLLILLLYQRAAAEVTLLDKEKDIDTSRANFSLYEFLHHSEAESANAPILSHAIIKADLRGSTEVTEKLTELELNPATHFDRNFFSPINAVIESYGAEKVFIEGDAIILILNDRGGVNHERLIAARACGLAVRILQIVAKQNRELVAYGLPELELGIGISYHNGPPRYLFDGQHRITISPAINRADRLSACNWSIRKWHEIHGKGSDHIEVYTPSPNAMGHGEKAQKDMVFNLNGILIEESVYQRIITELTPKKIQNPLPGIQQSSLYAFQFPDLAGTNHHLVIRQAPYHLFDPECSVDDCEAVENRYFYEVIHRREMLDQLKKHHD